MGKGAIVVIMYQHSTSVDRIWSYYGIPCPCSRKFLTEPCAIISYRTRQR